MTVLGFPTPEKANQPIISISCKQLNSNEKFVVFGLNQYNGSKDIEYIYCKDEETLLREFQQYWRKVSPDIISGWNITGFDIPYIINRSNKIMGEAFTKKFSPFHDSLEKCIVDYELKDQNGSSYRIVGITNMDYLNLYKKYAYSTLESLRLDVVANHELGIGKVDYDALGYNGLMDLYERNFDLFIDYNIQDTKIIEDFENKLNYMFLATTIAYLGKTKYSDAFTVVRWWDNHIYNSLLKRNIQIMPFKKKASDGIVGAFVKDPVPNRYSWIVTLDLTSLYPSIIMSFNISPEKFYKPACYFLDDIDDFIDMNKDIKWIKDANVAMLANGATFSRDGIGIFPELVDEMFNSRKTFKKHANAVSREIEEIKNREDSEEKDCLLKQKQSEEATFEAKQMAYKISLNSLYGALANAYFRYNSHDSAEGITTTGQLVIRFISKKLNEKLNELFKTGNVDYVIFNDTDSIFPDGIIETSKGKMSIEDLWNNIDTSLIEISKDNYIKCPNNIKSLSYNGSHIEWNNIVALKKHKVKKRMYRITVGGKTIRVTEDHSLQVERNGDLIKIKPHEIKEGDLFIVKL